jgi:hypothetical protein
LFDLHLCLVVREFSENPKMPNKAAHPTGLSWVFQGSLVGVWFVASAAVTVAPRMASAFGKEKYPIMNAAHPPKLPPFRTKKQYSGSQLSSILTISISLAFIFGLVVGLALRPGSSQTETLGGRSNPSGSSYSSAPRSSPGGNSFDAYRPAAEDVGRHWENETGRPMSKEDIQTIQGMMKTFDDNK